jgi:hypothetical protein
MTRTANTPAARLSYIANTLALANSATENRNALHMELAEHVYGTPAYKVTRAAFEQENGRMIALRTRWVREAQQFHVEFSKNVDARRTVAGLISKFPEAGLKSESAHFAEPNKNVLAKIIL